MNMSVDWAKVPECQRRRFIRSYATAVRIRRVLERHPRAAAEEVAARLDVLPQTVRATAARWGIKLPRAEERSSVPEFSGIHTLPVDSFMRAEAW